MVRGQGPEATDLLFSQPNDPLTFDPVACEVGLGHSEFTVGCTTFKSLKAPPSAKQARGVSVSEPPDSAP